MCVVVASNALSLDVRMSSLPNGLRITTVHLPHLHTVAIAMFVKAGSRFESREDNGLSHFLEHMLFRGTEAYPTSLDMNIAIESLGGTLYAETGRDLSMFHIALEPALVDAGLALLGELFCRPRFTDIERERDLIIEELHEDYDESGTEINSDDIARDMMFGDHPLGQRIIGPRHNVSRFSDADVRRHFERHYSSANMLLCVAGPLDTDATVASAGQHLAGLHTGSPVSSPPVTRARAGAQYKYVRDTGSQSSINVLFQSVPDMSEDYVASLALQRAIDDGMSTPLHYQLCDQKGLAYSLSASIEPLADVALFEIAGATSQAKVPELVRSVLELVGRFRTELITDAELTRIKRRYRYDLLSSMDDSYAVASWFGGTALYYPPQSFAERIARMEQVTREHIRAMAERIFQPERLVVAVVGSLSKARQGEVREAVTTWR